MLVTTNLQGRKPLFANPAYAREAIEVLYRVQQLYPFSLFAFVVMPDHIHLLLTVPEPQKISMIMNRFKMGVSHCLGLGPIWQSRFHLREVHNARNALRYIHLNPFRAGICEIPEEYPWSSASGKWDVLELDSF